MKRLPLHKKALPGFSLIEVIAVLMLMSILSAVAILSVGNDASAVIARADSLKSHLRYVQTRAMSTGPLYEDQSSWGIRLQSDNTSYFLFHCSSTPGCDPMSNQVASPGGEGILVRVNDQGIVLPGNQTLAFDRFGTPFTDASLTEPLSSELTLTLSDNSGNSRSITVLPVTGLIR